MPTTVVLTDVIFAESPSTKIRVRWGDGTESEYSSLEGLINSVVELDQDELFAKNLALGWVLARSADLSNIATIRNKDFTFDLSNPSPIRVQ